MSLLHLDEWGDGPAVLLLHGMPTTPDHLAPLGRALAVDRRAVVAHLPGYGQSLPLTGTYTMDRARDVLERTLLERDISDLDVFGFSAGAYRALDLALSGRVRIRRLFLLGGLAVLEPELRQLFGQFARELEAGADLREVANARFLSSEFADSPEAREEIASWLNAAPPEVVAAELRALAAATDLRPRLVSLRQPAILRVGSLDVATPAAWSEEIEALLPNARLEIVPGRGHALLLEDFEGTLESVRRFLAA